MNTTSLEGRNVVLEALIRGRKIFEILIEERALGDKIIEIERLAKANDIKITKSQRANLDKVAKTDSHQGVIAIAQVKEISSLNKILKAKDKLFIMIIKEVLYEHNLGAILRTAAACNVSCVVIPPTQGEALSPVVERVSMGASNIVRVCQESVQSALSIIKRAGVKIIGVETTGEKYYFEEDFTGSVALVLGGEDAGLSLPIARKCDIVVRMPMQNSIQSLNLSVAAAVVMFEKVRQDFSK